MNKRSTLKTFSVSLLTATVVSASACAPAASEPVSSARARLGDAATVLGSARSFAVLAGSTVTNTGATTLRGDLGVSPGLAITGFPPGIVTGGATHAGDAVARQAQTDVTTAFGALGAEACSVDMSGTNLGGLTLTPGVYCFSSSAQLTGELVLDAGGRADAVFVFKIASTLTTASNASVRMIKGGNACGVFWQVGSSATLGTGTVLAGNLLAAASITMTTGAGVSGRALARSGAVTMDTNAVSIPICDDVPSADGGVADAARADSGNPPADAGNPSSDAGAPQEAGTRDASADGAADAGAGEDSGCCGLALCGGACVDLNADRNNCGACGSVCAAGESCSLGVCTTICD